MRLFARFLGWKKWFSLATRQMVAFFVLGLDGLACDFGR